MGHKAYEETVKDVTEQYVKWGVEGAEGKARTEVAPLAERADRARSHSRPAERLIEPNTPLDIPMETHTVRVPVDDENNWGLEKATGNASPRSAFHSRPNREAMKTFHDRSMEALRKRLGG